MTDPTYEAVALHELYIWQRKMQEQPSLLNQVTRKMQVKVNNLIPEKVHQVVTAAIKQMIRATLFGAQIITFKPVLSHTLRLKEIKALERIAFYKKLGAAEGGVTGAGGILLGLADFPLLLGLKLKLLFDLAAAYGYATNDYRERVYLLYIFQLAFSSQEHRRQIYLKMENWTEKRKTLPDDMHQFDWRSLQQEYRDYIDLAKMAQLIPIIGAPVGAVVNYRLLNKLGVTAMNAYRMRWQEEKIAADKLISPPES
nr:EcsC family protein [Adhaeribacter aerolatus]